MKTSYTDIQPFQIRPNLQTVSHHIAKYPIIVEELHKEIARLKQANKSSDSQSLESESGKVLATSPDADAYLAVNLNLTPGLG